MRMEPPPTVTTSRPSSLPSSPHRPALRPGSLQRLLRPPDDPDADDDDSAATPRSRSHYYRAHGHGHAGRDRVLLQVTNITPALSDADPFSGHHGFYLRLSDSSRSCYVSLHADHDDLILADGLHIGQIIEVERLVPAVPVPVLRRFRVLPGRYPCVQHQDSGDVDEVKEVVSERSRRPSPRARQAGSPAAIGHHCRSRSTTNLSEAGSPGAAAAKRRENDRRPLESPRMNLRKISVPAADATSSDDDESDVSSSLYSSSLSTSRRNWDFTGSIKDVRPVASRRRSNSMSPRKSGRNPIAHQNEAATDPLESVRRKAEKAFKVLSKRNADASTNKSTPRVSLLCAAVTQQSASSSGMIKWCEDRVIWDSLSSSLVKHGKVAMKHRDMALQAVLDGLLEATASEKLIKCLSKYSELQSDKDDDPKELIDRFLRVSQDLDDAIFIAQSQTRLMQGKACCCSNSASSSASAKAATKAALDRKQSVISWIRSAIEADDLSSLPAGHTRVTSESSKASVVEAKPASPSLFRSKPKCNCSSRSSSNKKTADASTDGSNNPNAAMDLAIAMRSDCNLWFLSYIDKLLDDVVESETGRGYTACESQVAGFLQQLKKVDDWLNRVVQHERMMFTVDDRGNNKDGVLVHSEDEESDACERVRRKIYTALLRHVQFAAMALESSVSSSVTDEEKEQ